MGALGSGRGTHAGSEVAGEGRAVHSERDGAEVCSVTAQVCGAAAVTHCAPTYVRAPTKKATRDKVGRG